MNSKCMAILALTSVLGFCAQSALANPPTITLGFSDPQGLCKDKSGQTHFAFNYEYQTSSGVQYYSGPVNISSAPVTIAVPPPQETGEYDYVDFEITGQGDCGAMDLDYDHLGRCYLTNLIPDADQYSPDSYQITLTPEATGNHTYGNDMYNLTCQVEVQ